MKVQLIYGGLVFLKAIFATPLQAQQPITDPTISGQIGVSYYKTTMLVFPENIKDADRGSGDIIIRQAKKTANVLKVKAAKEGFAPTNLSVITADGRIFSIDVYYDAHPYSLAYNFGDQPSMATSTPVKFDEGLDEAATEALCRLVASAESRRNRPATNNAMMGFRLRNIFIVREQLLFSFDVNNSSQIPFDVHFIRFYERDRTKSKRTSLMEKEVQPRFTFFDGEPSITHDSTARIVVAFDKFTIADDKLFCIELYEKGGDRLLKLAIKGKHILRAKPLQPPAGQ